MFPLFLGMFLLIFFFTGIGNGSTYKMIPAIFRTEAERTGAPGSPERRGALLAGTKKRLGGGRHHRRRRRDRAAS